MKFGAILKRGVNLLKLGVAARKLRKSSTEDQHHWAKHYLVELLGQSRGLPAKVGQFMTMDTEDQALRESLNDSLTPMTYEEVLELIEIAYEKPWGAIFKKLDKNCKTASLGQVHFGKLLDGTEVAVKVQYPEIATAVEAEMNLMGWLPKVGPVAKWGFNMDGYRDAFWHNLNEELDYQIEAGHQVNYRQKIPPLERIVVPEVFSDLTRATVLVQKKEEGFGLDKAETMMPDQKQAMGRLLLQHYLHMLFRHGFVHADPQPANFAFRQFKKDYFVLIIYDYGSVMEIPDNVRLTLLRIILALRYRENLDPVTCLSALGFDAEKLKDLRLTLPALMSVLFEPFLVEAPYHVKDWRMSERFDQIVGDMKWWFRSSSPPELLFLMRTLHGLTSMLKRLDVALPWQFIMDKILSDVYPEARALTFPEVAVGSSGPAFDSMANYLKVHVTKPNGNKVSLTMPARCADNIEEVMDDSVKESIQRQNIDLLAIQDKARKSGFIPQVLFELSDVERDMKVWLE
ncbi:MAG: AarF/ABC1/UbiB kinase family protein [Nitrospinaceae bacterium]|nr:AarF/ABC1/UbiB kinase family protein [Nitrospinaceae bacterium]